MSKLITTGCFLACTVALAMALISGCGALLPQGPAPPLLYSLEARPDALAARPPPAASGTAPTLIINPPHAAPGYDSQHIVYVQAAHQLQYFARSDWVDTPAHMLVPIMTAALDASASFRAVGSPTSGMSGDLRLDSEILRLRQEFGDGPSRVRFTLRVTLSDNTTRQVISWREFDESVAATSENPYGGVVAANRAVQDVMDQLTRYCTLAAESWRASHPATSKTTQ